MSAQEFKPGDTVRFTDLNRAVGSPFWPGAVYTVNYVRQDGMVSIRGIDKPALAKHFEKVEHAEPEDKDDLYVEPERVTRMLHINGEGSGDVGAACGHELATGPGASPKHVGHSRSSFIGWIAGGGRDLSPETDACAECVALAQQPVTAPSVDNSEDATEPEPLKEGDWVQVWAQVGERNEYADEYGRTLLMVHGGNERRTLYAMPDAIVRPAAGQVPPWVKPARCTSLYATGSVSNSLLRCEHGAGHEAKHVVGWVAWTDDEAYGRVEVSS